MYIQVVHLEQESRMKPFEIAYFKEISSTNDQVKRALRAHANERYVCRAQKQTGGYGRQGRLWTSPEGGLYQSLLLRKTKFKNKA